MNMRMNLSNIANLITDVEEHGMISIAYAEKAGMQVLTVIQ